MKRIILISFCFISLQFYAQVKIGETPQNLNSSSILELESTDKVFVLTRVSSMQMNAISPLQGALVYNIDQKCIYQFDGTKWKSLCENSASGDAITSVSLDQTTNILTLLLNSGTTRTVDLSSLDNSGVNTDNQTITDFSFEPTTHILSISLENGNTRNVDLSSLNSSLDNQQLNFDSATNILTLENGGTVNLSSLINNTDNQQLSIDATGHVITLENGSSVTITDTVYDDTVVKADIAAVQADVDNNQTTSELADTALQADIDQNELDTDASDTTLQSNIDAVQADVDNNQTASELTDTALQADIATKEDSANKSTDGTLIGNSDDSFPTEQAVKTYVDAAISASNTADGDTDSTNEIQTVSEGDGITVTQTVQDYNISAATDNTTIGINASKELEIIAGTDGQVLTTVGTEVKWTKAVGLMAETYLATGSQAISDTFTTINFGTPGIVDTENFTTTINTINITQPGIYKITYRVSLEFATNSNNRTESEFQLINGGTVIPGTTTFGYHRNAVNNKDTATATKVIQVTGTATIAVQARKVSGSAILQTIPNAVSLLIEKQ